MPVPTIITKPFAIEELFARIRVALKRAEAVRAAQALAARRQGCRSERRWRARCDTPASVTAQASASPSPATLTVDSVALDPDRREVMVGGSPIVLTAREFDVLALLMAHAETVLTRERIAHEALGYEYMGDTNNVDVHIAHLRAKIEDAGGARIIQTVRGVGYVCRA
ncbi:MAG: winged helix-turn-helix domain-containing protein [Collinsella sp.]